MPARHLAGLLLVQGTRPNADEDHFLRADIDEYYPAPASTPGKNSTNVAKLDGGRKGFHKPYRGQESTLAGRFGHDWASVVVGECGAWRVARALGPPYSDLVPVTVLRYHQASVLTQARFAGIADGWGSLCAEQPGWSLDPTPLGIAHLTDAAAFFDALVAQQDRHMGQFRWDQGTQHLGLIDHGFCFARRGDRLNESVFVRRRHADGRQALSSEERDVLSRVVDPGFGGALRVMLEADRVDAVQDRAERMLSQGELLAAGEW